MGEIINTEGTPEQQAEFERWFKENQKRIGEITVPQVGEYPPNINNFYGSIINEWVTPDLIRHYVDAHGDRNPLYRSEEYAKRSVWGGLIAPPTFTDSLIQGYPYKFEPDQFAKFNNYMQVPNGTRRELYKPIRPGDKIHAVHRYLGLTEVDNPMYEKPIRVFDEAVERTLYNQREEIVAIITTHNHAFLNYAITPDNPIWGVQKKNRITDEERDEITAGYDNETRRGSTPFYFEDVKEGEKISLHPIGPYTPYDVVAFYTAMSGHAVAFECEWERVRIYPEFGWIDPETNGWTCNGVCHICDNKGHAPIFTGGLGLGFYNQVEGLLGRMLTNWGGDSCFVTLLDTRSPVYPFHGAVLNCKGVVTKLEKKTDYGLVDLDVWCEDSKGVKLTIGTAQVKLPTKIR